MTHSKAYYWGRLSIFLCVFYFLFVLAVFFRPHQRVASFFTKKNYITKETKTPTYDPDKLIPRDREAHDMILTWKDICVTPKPEKTLFNKEEPPGPILNNLSGFIQPGKMLAIIGKKPKKRQSFGIDLTFFFSRRWKWNRENDFVKKHLSKIKHKTISGVRRHQI